MMLHDQVIADGILDELHRAQSRVETVLEFSSDNEFLKDHAGLLAVRKMLPSGTVTREQLKVFLRASHHLAGLIRLQSQWVEAYYEWIDQEPTPTLKKTRKLSPEAATDGNPLVKTKTAQSERSWLAQAAQSEYRRIEDFLVSKATMHLRFPSTEDRSRLRDLELRMETQNEIPEFYGSWLRAHLQSVRHYHVDESRFFFELVDDLRELFAGAPAR